AFGLAGDEVGLRRRRRSTTSLFQTDGSRRSENVRGSSESLAFAQNFGFNFQTATQDKHPRSRGAMRPRFFMKSVRPEKQRAQGMPGAQCTRGLACEIK